MEALDGIDQFETQFAEMVAHARLMRHGNSDTAWRQLICDEAKNATATKNFREAIAKFGPRDIMLEELNRLESEAASFAQRRAQLERRRSRPLELPTSLEALRAHLDEKLRQLAHDSFEIGDLLRQLVPEFHVYLVRLADGGHLLPRARLRLSLAGDIADAAFIPGLAQFLSQDLTVDLFRQPPQRERIRIEASRRATEGMTQGQIAAALTERPKLPVVQDSLMLDRLLSEKGLASPYVFVTEPPADYPKLRRHKNGKYRFESQPGYVRPSL
jgi:hypothetical protein